MNNNISTSQVYLPSALPFPSQIISADFDRQEFDYTLSWLKTRLEAAKELLLLRQNINNSFHILHNPIWNIEGNVRELPIEQAKNTLGQYMERIDYDYRHLTQTILGIALNMQQTYKISPSDMQSLIRQYLPSLTIPAQMMYY